MRKALVRSSVLALAVMAAMSGCASSTSGTGSLGPASPGASATGASGGEGTGGATPTGGTGTGTPTSSTGSGGAGGNNPPSYPSTEKAYVQAMLDAWAARDHTRQDQLATKQAFDFLPRVDMHWHNHACNVHDGTYEDCVFDNNVGDRITVVVDPTKIGKPQAVQSASIDKTTYGTTVDNYVGAWISAWDDGNRYRMIQLSSSSFVGTFSSDELSKPFVGSMLTDTTQGPAGTTYVRIDSNNHDEFVVQVKTSLLGKPHAISAVPLS